MVATPTKIKSVDLYRGCGKRTQGSTYATSTLEELDWNLDEFLLCSPWPIDLKEVNITNQGVAIVQRPGTQDNPIFDAWDIVGSDNYSIAGFVEEARAVGISRKVDNIIKTKQHTLLTPESRYFLVHRYGLPPNFDPLYDDRQHVRGCPGGIEHHDDHAKGRYGMCLALQWEMVGSLPSKETERTRTVEWPENRPDGVEPLVTFEGAYSPKGWQPEVGYAAFMWLPAEALLFEIIHDPVEGKDRDTLELLEQLGSTVPYAIVEE